jgi:hypothetical protein
MVGVITAQLFRLQHAAKPNMKFGFFVLGIPVAATFNGAALIVVMVGAHRFWRQQNAMVRGKCHAGGWELLVIGGLSILVSSGPKTDEITAVADSTIALHCCVCSYSRR